MIICSPELGLNPESNSGGEVYDREVIERLCRAGIKVLTLLPKDRPFQNHVNLRVEFAPIKPMVPPHIFNVFVLPYLVKTYKAEKFDLLRVHNPYFVGPAAAIFKKLYPHVPVVASYLHLETGFNRLIDRQVINIFDRIITISEATKNEIIGTFGYPAKKITVAYPGVDNRFNPAKYKSDRITVMFVGGLKPRKNPEFLLKVMAKINRDEVDLVFAGDGPLRRRLTGKNISVTGYIPEKEKPKIYQRADIVVLPSIKEGFGMTLLEAGMSGLPVVANNSWSIPEIVIDGKTGFLAKYNDVDDWADKLLSLINSANMRREMGVYARKHVQSKFTWENNINQQIKVYENLVR